MLARISLDQTLFSLVLSVLAAWLAYAAAARVLRRQALARDLRQQRDALQQVLAALSGAAAAYLADDKLEYPQREMVELERRALQAQILFWSDLRLQQALRAVTYPGKHEEAAATLRVVALEIEAQLRAVGG